MFVWCALGATSKINAVVGEHRTTFCALHQAKYLAAGQPLSGWFSLTTVKMLWCSWDCKNFQGWLSDSSVSSKFCRKVSDFLTLVSIELIYIFIMSRVYGSIGIWSFHRSWYEFFLSRYGFLLPLNLSRQDDTLSTCLAILKQFKIPLDMYQVGYTKLFFRAGQVSMKPSR